jgi:tetratricopeptide (TPR) repeat protein
LFGNKFFIKKRIISNSVFKHILLLCAIVLVVAITIFIKSDADETDKANFLIKKVQPTQTIGKSDKETDESDAPDDDKVKAGGRDADEVEQPHHKLRVYGIDPEIFLIRKKNLPRELWDRKGLDPDYDKEMAYLSAAIKKEPNNADLFFLMARIYFARQEMETAALWAEKAIAKNPSHRMALELCAHSHFIAERYEKAKQACMTGMTKYPNNPFLFYVLASCYHYGEYDLRTASHYYLKAHKLDPDNPVIRLGLAESYLAKRGENNEKGIAVLEQAIKDMPDYYDFYVMLGEEIHITRGDNKRSVALLKKAISMKPQYYMPYQALGELYMELGFYDEAVKYYTETLKRNPEYVGDVYTRMGQVEYCRGNIDESYKWSLKAIQHFNEIDDKNKKACDACLTLARIEWEKDRYTESENFLKRGIEFYPGHEDLYYYYTLYYLHRNDINAARHTAAKCHTPHKPESNLDPFMQDYLKAQIFARQNNWSKVKQYLKKAALKDPNDFCYRDAKITPNFAEFRKTNDYRVAMKDIENKRGFPIKKP